jgi:hypothetical protein
MFAYRYDEETKEYLGTQEAQINPLEGGYLLPANCTFLEVPEYEEKQIPVFENEIWIVKVDNRGSWQVKLDDVTFSKVDYIGEKAGYQVISDEVYEEYQADNDRFKVIDGVFTDISDTEEYKEKKRQEEAERVANLQCTKRVFVLMLEQLGLDYFEQIEPVINANREAKLEWELCVQLQRKNPLLDQLAGQFGITPKQLDDLFKYANGEITQQQFLGEK